MKNVVSCVAVKCPPQVALDVIVVPREETAGMDPQVKSSRGAFVYTHWKRTRGCVWMGGWLLAAGMLFFFLFFFTEWEMRGVGVNYGTMKFLFPFFFWIESRLKWAKSWEESSFTVALLSKLCKSVIFKGPTLCKITANIYQYIRGFFCSEGIRFAQIFFFGSYTNLFLDLQCLTANLTY